MKPDTAERIRRYALSFLLISAQFVLVAALFVSALGVDLSKLTLS